MSKKCNIGATTASNQELQELRERLTILQSSKEEVKLECVEIPVEKKKKGNECAKIQKKKIKGCLKA
ncbi:hypothetical protein F8M41_012664 [Gigaspora margarita]|uniref:Uncharacterized protein n=1 Tax=Gigaspora margarita TaxID=4874 RepID=A0A8H4A0X3_GIGMA|nr:hypothetical protein F8M41_012664 [Gigaspora margarita]